MTINSTYTGGNAQHVPSINVTLIDAIYAAAFGKQQLPTLVMVQVKNNGCSTGLTIILKQVPNPTHLTNLN